MMSTRPFLALAVALSFAGAEPATAQQQLRLSNIFGDDMVLQRGVAVPIWGWSSPGDRVEVNEGVRAGEGDPEQVMTDRGLVVVRDDSLIQAAVDDALAANPDIAEKIRGGKVQAAGAIVGAVMKATKGQADAARVRELVMAACS